MDEAVSAPSLTRRIVVSLVAIALVLGAGAAAFQRLAAMKKPPARALGGPPLPVVRVQPVTRGDYPETLRGYGVARALRVTHVAAEVTGIVEEVSPALRSGSRITLPPIGTNGAADNGRVGPPLVRIDDHDLQVALSRLRIEREQAATEIARWEAEGNAVDEQLTVVRERLETAKAELLRIEKLVPDTLPESDLDRQRLAVLALAQMESELASRKLVFAQQIRGVEARIASLEEGERKASKDIERTVVSAPFPGLVTARHVEQGDRVAPGSPLFDMIDPSLVEIAIALPAGRYGEVVRGSQAVIYASNGEQVLYTGEVARIDPIVDSEVRTFRVYVEIDAGGADSPIPPGQHVVADISGAVHEDVIAVPREAFLDDLIYVAEPAGQGEPATARGIRPTIRRMLAGVALVAPEGGEDALQSGDEVVVSNLEDIAEGSKLRIAPPVGATGGR